MPRCTAYAVVFGQQTFYQDGRLVRTGLDVLSGPAETFCQDRPALNVLSGRHFFGTTVDVLSGPSNGWLQVVMDG